MGAVFLFISPGKYNFYYGLCKISRILLNGSAVIRGMINDL
jgi:hypothetical protein